MKKPNSSKLIATAGIALGLTGIGLGVSHAASSTDTTTTQSTNAAASRPNPMQSLITAIAQKFNLSTTDVQAVFDEQHTQMEAQHKAEEATRLAAAVANGTLTQAQADAITVKKAELESAREANKDTFQNLTPTEREAKMTAERDALKAWATENNIPEQYLMFLGGGHGGRNGHGDRGFGGPGAPAGQVPIASTTQAN